MTYFKDTLTRNKIVLSLGLIFASAAYALSVHQNSQTSIGTTQGDTSSTGASTENTQTTAPSQSSAQYANGSYTGSAEDAYYGTIQVKAIISDGKITDVQFLQHPYQHENSVFINTHAMPLLTQEAISAQSANVDGVSGASFTSAAFKKSLATALAQATN